MHIIIHNEAGEIRNKYTPVTDFARVGSVGACPNTMIVDTAVRFILYLALIYCIQTLNSNFDTVIFLDMGSPNRG